MLLGDAPLVGGRFGCGCRARLCWPWTETGALVWARTRQVFGGKTGNFL